MFGFLPNVIKRSGCFWSLQLLLWNTTFTETSLYWMLKETGSLFDTNRCAFGGLGLCSRRIAMEEGDVLFCPWSLTSTIALCSFWFSVVPVDNHMWRNLNTMVKENWKVNMKNKNAIKVEIKVCLPNKQLLGLNRSHEIIRTFFFFPLGKRPAIKQSKIKLYRTQVFRATEYVLLNRPDVLSPFLLFASTLLYNIMGVEASLFMLHNAISFLDVCTSLCFLGGGCS